MKNACVVALLISITLVSCAPQVIFTPEAAGTPTPPASPTSEATSTPEPTATPSAEIVLLGGVTLTLDENGVAIEMIVNGNYTDEQKAEKLKPVDPVNWGFEADEVQIIKDNSKIYLALADNPELKIAQWFGSEWLWNWEVMEGLEGGNPLFGFAKTYPTVNGGDVRVTKEVRADAAEIRAFAGGYPIYLYNSEDKAVGIIASYRGDNKLDPNEMIKSKKSEIVDGWIGFKARSGELVRMRFEDIEVFIRGYN